jgi:hypothetical protein
MASSKAVRKIKSFLCSPAMNLLFNILTREELKKRQSSRHTVPNPSPVKTLLMPCHCPFNKSRNNHKSKVWVYFNPFF